MTPEKCCKIIVAWAILHNMCRGAGVPDPDLESEDATFADDESASEIPKSSNNVKAFRGNEVRRF